MTQPLIRVVDVETSSLDDDARVCEVGWCDVWHNGKEWCPQPPVSEMVNPGVFIKPEASAVHHITDAMVRDCRPADVVLEKLARADVDMWAAHNSRFDSRFFNPDGAVWLCTYRLAVRAWPDAPNFKNQTLRYYLGLPISVHGLPHRARLDAYVTGHILAHALNHHCSPDQVAQISSVPAMMPRCMMKKHRGKLWRDVARVDRKYLEWYLGADDRDPDTEFTVRHWLAQQLDATEGRAAPPLNPADYVNPTGAA